MLYSRFFAKDMRKDILTGFGGPASGGGLLRSYPSVRTYTDVFFNIRR